MHLFKRKKIVLTAFTEDETLLNMFPVIDANKKWPSYYQTLASKFKKLEARNSKLPDNVIEMQSTIRACYGINNFNNHGIILPLWAEYSSIIDRQNISVRGAADNRCSYHEPQQALGSLDLFHIIKLESPWEFHCNKDIKWLMIQNFFDSNSDKWCITPGITDFYHQSTTNIFLLVNKNQPSGETLFKAGTPLAKFIPLCDEEVELRYEVVDDIKKVKIKPFKYFFHNGLTKMMKAKKTQQEKKCPFNWK